MLNFLKNNIYICHHKTTTINTSPIKSLPIWKKPSYYSSPAAYGMKMMQLSDEILREHYAHLVDRPFFPALAASMQASPVIALALEGRDAVQVVRTMTGSTNGREAAPGTIRGDYSISNQQNIVHASDSTSNAEIELKRFFRDDEIFEYTSGAFAYVYGEGEAK